MWGARHSFGVFFGPLLDEFGWTRTITSGGFSLAWIVTGALSVGVGRLNDRFGPRKVMTVAGILLSLGYLLMSTLNTVWQLYLFFGIISIGMSAVFVPLMSTVARWFVKMRAMMTGIILTSGGIAMVALLPLASRLISDHGWRFSYAALGTLVLVVVVLAAQFLKRDPAQMGLLPYGGSESNTGGSSSQSEGMFFREAFRTRQLWLLSGIYFCSYFLFYLFLVHIIIHATGQGISQVNAVGIVSLMGAGGIIGRVLWGIIADRVGNKRTMVGTAVLLAITLFWLLVAKDLWMLCLFGVLFGFSHGGMAVLESPTTAEIFGMRSHGSLLGFVFFADTIGGAIGPVLAGYIFDATNSYYLAFLICAMIGMINLTLVLLLKPIKYAPENK